jgi:uncharacterized protein YkwD
MTRTKLWTLFATLIILMFGRTALAASQPAPAKTQTPQTKASHSDLADATIPTFPPLPTAPCPTDAVCQPLDRLAKAMVELVNQDRSAPANDPETKGKALPLKWDPRLAAVALAHSEDMVQRGYFSHVDPNGNSPVERICNAGIRWESMGENIAINYTSPLAEAAFMNEPRFQVNHRANILNPKFNSVGIGIVRAPNGMLYVTQDFAYEP